MPQIALMGGPILLPLWIAARARSWRLAITSIIIGMLAAGWGYAAYTDTRPYLGGGASFAILFGWFSSLVATLFAAIAVSAEPEAK